MGKIVKKTRRPTLKQQAMKQGKVVKVDNLLWKPVEVPDNLESYEGFFGLEEIDGVDVEYVNGKAQFKVKDETKVTPNDKKEKKEPKQKEAKEGKKTWKEIRDEKRLKKEQNKPQMEQESEAEDAESGSEADSEEFTGFDDDVADDAAEVAAEPAKSSTILEDLSSTPFNFSALPEGDVNLPHWKELKLSTHALTGLNALGFKSPTPIQKKSIPLALEGRDVIGKATTGSGKTLAYGLPILEKYMQNLEQITHNRQNKVVNPPTGIIFVPTRELAHQVVDHLNGVSKYFPLAPNAVVSVTGGLSIQKQERLLKSGPGIVVVTPGRCLELMEKDEELIKRFSRTDIIVLDEADRLLQDGHFDEFEKILTMFKKHRPRSESLEWKWQTLVFSATFARELFSKLNKHSKSKGKASSLVENDEVLSLLNEKLQFKDKKPVLVDANPTEMVSGQVTEALVECGATERDLYLYYFLLVYKGSTLVFANSIDTVKRLIPFLTNLNIPAFAIHSGMVQKQRLRALERFKAASESSDISVLVASDVASRGLDIPNIDHVAHYHLPRSADLYIHRSGRTARAGREGVSVMFCSPQEASGPLRKLRKLVAANGSHTRINPHNDVKLLPIEDNLVAQLAPRTQLAAKLANAVTSDSSSQKQDNWVKQAAEDLGIDDLSDIDDFEDDMIKRDRKRRENKTLTKDEARAMRYELKELLKQPIRKLSRRSYLTSGLENLAHIMVTGNTHKDILGHQSKKALQDLKGKSYKVTKPKKDMKKIMKDRKQERKDEKKDKREQKREAQGFTSKEKFIQ